jgi:ABC-type branched-subunit amino acid transport system ATPase component
MMTIDRDHNGKDLVRLDADEGNVELQPVLIRRIRITLMDYATNRSTTILMTADEAQFLAAGLQFVAAMARSIPE